MKKRKPEAGELLAKQIGGRVRLARTRQDVSPAEIGRLLGFEHGATLYRYERGARLFTIYHLTVIAERLDVSLHWLITGREFRSAPDNDTGDDTAGTSLAPAQLSILGGSAIDALRQRYCSDLSESELLILRDYLSVGGNSEAPIDLAILIARVRVARDPSDANQRALFSFEQIYKDLRPRSGHGNGAAPAAALTAETPRRRKGDPAADAP